MPDCPIHPLWLYEEGSYGWCPRCKAWYRIETRAIKSSKTKVHPDKQTNESQPTPEETK